MNLKRKHLLSLSFSQTYIYRHAEDRKRNKQQVSVRELLNVEPKSLAPISISISIPKFLYHGMQRRRWIMHAECRFPVSLFPSPFLAPSLSLAASAFVQTESYKPDSVSPSPVSESRNLHLTKAQDSIISF
jgi:hypothetical protein